MTGLDDTEKRLLDAQGLMHNARGILRLAEKEAFFLSETLESGNADSASSISIAIEASRRLIAEALELVDIIDFPRSKANG